jgi:hypothetical protein
MKRRPGSGTWPASRWPELFEAALALLAAIPGDPIWSLGGGTRLALLYDHRNSYDVDLFVADAQIIPYLSPRLNDAAAALVGDSYEEDSASLKLSLAAGDIGVIVAPILTDPGVTPAEILGRTVPAQTAEEILAKKIQYRGHAFTHRDAFDLAMLLERDPGKVEIARSACGAVALARMAERLRRLLPVLAAELPDFVNPTAAGQPLLATAADRIAAWLGSSAAPNRA